MTTALRQEDPTKRKKFNKLTLRDISVVKEGGHQNAQILIKRSAEEAPVSFMTRLIALFAATSTPPASETMKRSYDDDAKEAPTTSEILRVNEMRTNMMRVNNAFEESMWRIMGSCKGKDLVVKMKRSVEEYGNEMDSALSKAEELKRFISDDEVRALGKSLLTVSEHLAKLDDGGELPTNAVQEIQRSLAPANNRDTVVSTPATSPPVKENPMSLKEALAKATPAEIEELKRSLSGAAPVAPKAEEILRAAQLDPEVKKSLDTVLARNEELARNNVTLVERLDRLEKERDDAVTRTKAKEFLTIMNEEKAMELVRSGNATLLDIAREQAKTKKTLHESLTRERGAANPVVSGEASGAGEEIERKAKVLMTEKPADYRTMAEARAHVRETNPDLASAERA